MKTIPFPVIHPSKSAYLRTDRPHIAVQARDDPNTPESAQVYLLVYKTRQGRWAKRTEYVKVISHNLLGLGTATAKASVKAQIEYAISVHGTQVASRKLVEVIFYRGIKLLAIESVEVAPKYIFKEQES